MQKHINIPPVIIGELTFTDMMGNTNQTPGNIQFNQDDGTAVTVLSSKLYGTLRIPVYKTTGERLSIPGYAGLECDYDAQTGTLKNFKEQI